MILVRYFVTIMSHICNKGFQEVLGVSAQFCRVLGFLFSTSACKEEVYI
jgi:hypothetical protein